MHHALRICAGRFGRAAVNRRFHRGVGESSTPSWSDNMAAKKGRKKAAKKGGRKAAKKGGRKAAKKGGRKRR